MTVRGKALVLVVIAALVLLSCQPPRGATTNQDPDSSWSSQPDPGIGPAKQACMEISKEQVRHALFFEPDYCFVDTDGSGNGYYFLYRVNERN